MKKRMLSLILAAVVLFVFAACGGGNTPNAGGAGENGGIFHSFDELGFSFEIPVWWAGKYAFEAREFAIDDGIGRVLEVYHPATREALSHRGDEVFLGQLVSIRILPGEEFDGPAGRMLAQAGGYTYFMNTPIESDHYEDPDSEAALEFMELISAHDWAAWDFIAESFRLA